MFSSFKDTFIRKPQYRSKPPKAVIDAINKDLPNGFKYVYVDNGFCKLDASEGFTIESGRVNLPKDVKEFLPDNPSWDQIQQYLYNSQTALEIFPNEEGCFKINDVSFKANDIVKAPLRDITIKNGRLYLKPSPFPPPFELLFSGNGYEITLQIRRMSNKSLFIQRFQNTEETPLSVVYDVDTVENKFTITFTLHINNAKTVHDVLSAYEIYNAFIDGTGEIEGTVLSDLAPISEKKIPQETVDFWEKLYKIENALEISFDIKDGVTVSDARFAEELFRCIIQKKPYKVYKQYNTVKGKKIPQDISNAANSNQEIYFEYTADCCYELLGQTISLKGIFGIFGACIKDIFTCKEQSEVILQTAEGKKMYESVMLFLTDDDVNEFRKNSEYFRTMENAEEITSLES